MSFSFILSLVSIILVILLVIIGVVLCLYLTINENFEAQPLSLTEIVNQNSNTKPVTEPVQPPVPDEEVFLEHESRMLMSPIPVLETAGKVATFIDLNRAVVNAVGSYGSFAPTIIRDPYKFEHWSSPPARHSFTVTAYNSFGQRILQFEYNLQFVHGGSLSADKLYLNTVTVIPSVVFLSWGFKFNAHVNLSSVRNVGTRDHPIAAVTIDQNYCLIGLNTVQRTDSFEVRGDGTFNRLNQPSHLNH